MAFSVILLTVSMGLLPASMPAAGPVKIGVLLPLTGGQNEFGHIEKKSAHMAVDEINADGGVNGKKIDLVIADTQGNPDAGRAAIERLIHRDEVLSIGGGFSKQPRS